MATVPASTRSTTYTLASASAGPFLVGFRIFDPTLLVYVDDALRTDFVLTASFSGGYADDAEIVFDDELPADSVVQIDGAQPIARSSDYLNPDPNLTRLMNIEFGRVWAAMQQIARDTAKLNITQQNIADVIEATSNPLGVRAYGAGLGGDDTAAFSAAALAATAVDNIGSPWSAVPHALVCRVLVPAGYYTLSSLVDTGGRDVTWELDPAAIITGIEYINGAVDRPDRVTRRFGNGTLGQGTGIAVAIGGDYDDKPPGVTGVTTIQQLADYTQHDAVALVAAAYATPAVIDVGTATYTATTATIAAPGADAVKRLRRGDIIYTKHSPKCAGLLSSWNADGSVLTVTEWREDGGSAAVTPANGTGLSIGVQKIYAINAIAMLTPTGFATQSIGQEISNRNTLGDSTDDIDDPTNRVWGYLSAAAAEGTAGYYKSQAAFIARGSWHYAYYADNQDTGYAYRSSVAGGKTSFFSRSHFDNTLILATDTTDKQRYAISGRGDVTHGDPTVAAASGRYIQFATSGLSAAYDVKLAAIGGTASAGQGILGAYAKQIGLNTVTPDASACLDISNSALGFLPPRMTSATRDAIASPTNGLVIWNITTSKLQVRAAGAWTDLH